MSFIYNKCSYKDILLFIWEYVYKMQSFDLKFSNYMIGRNLNSVQISVIYFLFSITLLKANFVYKIYFTNDKLTLSLHQSISTESTWPNSSRFYLYDKSPCRDATARQHASFVSLKTNVCISCNSMHIKLSWLYTPSIDTHFNKYASGGYVYRTHKRNQ